MNDRPRIGVSACLLGEAVRYDGGHKAAPGLVAALRAFAELVPLCPEAGAGLGVPRPPVDLHWVDGEVRMRGVEDPGWDPTAAVLDWIAAQAPLLAGLHGAVLKARSPSCGIGTTPLHLPGGGERLASGLFAAHLAECRPRLPLADEEALSDHAALADFRERVLACWRGAA